MFDRFSRHDPCSEPVIGTYMYPYRIFGRFDRADPSSAIKIVKIISIDGEEVFLTCNGGLFIRPPDHLPYRNDQLRQVTPEDRLAKRTFEEHAVHLLNRVICEFTLRGIVSAPATLIHLGSGERIENYAQLNMSVVGREIYTERTLLPSFEFLHHLWFLFARHLPHDLDVVESVSTTYYTSELVTISEYLPTLISGAYSLFSQHQLSEAVIDGWIVIEQIIDWFWTEYVRSIPDKDQKKRLSDYRTYSVAVRLDMLHTVNVLPFPLCQVLHRARKHRNDLAHRAKINLAMATESLDAMKQLIEFVCKVPVEPPMMSPAITRQ